MLLKKRISKEYATFRKDKWTQIWNTVDDTDFQDPLVKRQIKSLKKLGSAALDDPDFEELESTTRKMSTLYGSAKICPYKNENCSPAEELSLNPQIEKVLSSSMDYDELTYTWKAWRDKSGKLMKNDYETYVKLMNKAAKANDFKDASEWWQSVYEESDFVKMVDDLWTQIEPLYDELHTYVRYKLYEIYGNKMDKSEKNIPAHLLGNMWAQDWVYLYDKTKPFPNASLVDVTAKLNELKYEAKDMFERSNEFYLSMGLEDNKMSYDPNLALIEKPTDGREVECHASAWDLCDDKDYRIKMCTNINMKDFITIHHEMGHIQYYLQYNKLPLALRGGANPGFHEAVGDTIALAVATPQHLQKINFLDDYKDTNEDNINALYSMALERLAFLPFGLLIDKWRWEVFAGLPKNQWNTRWWELREKYQKVSAPVPRSEDDFDPGAKYHVPANSQYIAYFIAHVLEFQMYRALCIEAKEFDPDNIANKPLHKCDFFESAEAGKKLSDGLKLGTSEHWSIALEKITGSKEISSEAFLEYFQPLYDFLKKKNEELRMKEILEKYNTVASKECNSLVTAEWNFNTNLNVEEIEQALLDAQEKNARFVKEQYELNFKGLNPDDYEDEGIRRQLKLLTKLGTDILDEADVNELGITINSMTKVYNNAKVCPYRKQNCDLETEGLTLDPHIDEVLSTSQDYDEQKYIWQKWHEHSGKLMRSDYKNYVRLMNKAAVLNGYNDAGDMWRADYEDPNLSENMNKLWAEIEPLYDDLHTYVRYKLAGLYDTKWDGNGPLIPAHILGNMWAQSWVNLFERIKPFPNASDIDVTPKMIEQGYTPLKMFQESDRFYKDLGLESNDMSYGPKAIIEKPDDRLIVCHASAWDFCDGEDFRIKQCTTVDMNDFETVHHEMGHIQYYILYKDQALPFRTGANPGFHEAVGDLIALSVSTPNHLEKIGLIDDYKDTTEDNINALMKMALQRVAFMPFGLLIDTYRWDIFSGKVPETEWNSHWEKLREKYQKIKSPVQRDETDFDAGAKYHVGANSQYMNYFFAHVLEFQLHKAMCIEAGQYDPNDPKKALHKCDIDGSKAVGAKLRNGLSLGMSKPWPVALKEMTGETELKADAMLEYFKPLRDFFKQAIKDLEEEHVTRTFLSAYSTDASNECNALVTADWDAKTDLTNEDKQNAYIEAVEKNAQFIKDQFNLHFKDLDPNDFIDDRVKRQVQFLSKLGTDILEADKLNELTKTVNDMESIYNSARVCPYNKQNCKETEEGLDLNEGITNVMATSTDYSELKYIWQKWHENSGRHMRKDYIKYVNLMNEAAVENKYPDAGVMWQADYEVDNFVENMKKLWSEIEPLYKELHTYVRGKLLTLYKDDMDANNELIPAHILGNMWAQSWVNLYERIKPFQNASDIDVTPKMIEQGYTAMKMFEKSDEFYQNLGLETNEMSYHPPAIIEQPPNKLIVCHASAWDFCDGNDFRIKQCTLINMVDFETVHHEMGHIQYFILYKDQPEAFRHGANPGFHEAVGDLIALSVSTPTHLEKIGLLEDYKNSEEDNINALLKTALKKVAFLPFGLLIDMYRWDIFSGEVDSANWNAHWEKLREQYQGIQSPVKRSEADFDAGAKYHVAANSQYMNYFFAHVLEFQLHKAMCIAAGQYDPLNPKAKPLHQCDIDGSKEAGQKLRDGLSLGMSKHWSHALKAMTGETELKADAILEYFQPLKEYLEKVNAKPIDPEPEPEPVDEPNDNLVPIIVGSVIGGLLVVALVGYGIYYFMKRR